MSVKPHIRLFVLLVALLAPGVSLAQLTITTNSPLPNGFVGQQYSEEIVAAGTAQPPTNWQIVAGELPPGLMLSFSFDPPNIAFVQGVPTQPGVFGFTARFSSGSGTAQKAFQLTIIGPLQITTSSPLPRGVAGVNYSTQIRASGGFPPYQWSVIAGTPPPGIMLNPQTGFLTGTTVAGMYSFLVQVMDSQNGIQEKNFTVRFVEPPVITTKSPLPPAKTGEMYTFQFMAASGTPPYSWSRSSPFFNLPAGLTISSGGLLSGTPTVSGTFRLPIRVTDSEGAVDSGDFDLQIIPGLQITTGSPLPVGQLGQLYQTAFMASGGAPPYNWFIVTGAAPTGLNLNQQTGVLQGTPTSSGPHTFTVRVRDAQELASEKQFTLGISQGARPMITTVPPLPNLIVGQRYMFPFAASGGSPPYRWQIATGALPPGLTLNPQTGEVSGTASAATNVEFTITVTDTQNDADAELFRLTSEVDPGLPPRPEFHPNRLLSSFTRQPRRAVQRIRVLNRGGGTLRYNVSATTQTGGTWIAVTPSQIDASSQMPGVVTVSILPPAAGSGACGANGCTLRGAVLFQPVSGGPPERIPVVAAVSPRDNLLRVAPQGLTFTGPGSGPHLPAQAVRVQNLGSGNVNWETVVTTVSGGNNWLLADPPSGTAGPDSADTFAVEVDPSGLAPGAYHGSIEVRSPNDQGGARLITVIANIVPPGANVTPFVEPRGLIFTTPADGDPPPGQRVRVLNPGSNPVLFDALIVTMNQGNTALQRTNGLSVAARSEFDLSVQPNTAGLGPGVYRGYLQLLFGALGTRTVNLSVIVYGSRSVGLSPPRVSQGACTPTRLVPELTSFSGGYPANAAWPAYLRVQVMDDCMNPLTQGTVTARFGNGNPADLALGNAAADGTWLGTLTFPASMPNVSNSVIIEAAGGGAPALTGSATRAFEVGGLVDSPPVLVSEGIVNGASFEAHPLSPGSIFSVFGTGLSNRVFNAGLPFGGGEQAPSLPIPTTLGGTRLFFAGGGFAPILFSLDLQVNAITPFALSNRVNESVDVRAQRGGTLSMPVPVLVTDSQPAMFTQTGTGAGAASIVHLDGSLVNAAKPAVAGEVILVFLTGLGAVNPAIQDGHPSCEPDGNCLPDGSNLVIRSTAAQASMTIGGVAIPQGNIGFAGLAPGFAGLYQMNVVMPAGLPSGDQALKVTLGSQTSPDGVTIRIQ